ncbi:beta-ketoacyl-ACP synthase III [Desulfovermiculus halophilus]|jgi:3-oxoacyl-[acyl-carrier-protein] synthase-3|uniref:beta-ketoacyl-ACP synthase III n=1 Tax=Desulfovermiculus halophilus TaxID=339722 RepID=UPI0004867B56|nr:beta-ketoacyl-ACP synthase III [Desulfovermiculus halophilus]
MYTQSYLLGVGYYVPERILSNSDLEQLVETSDEWITTRTGIKERRIAGTGQSCSDLALNAAGKALQNAGMGADQLTHILVATFTPDYCEPTTACLVQSKLGASRAMMAMDLAAGCSGYTYGLDTARGIVAVRPDSAVLVVGSEVCTSKVNFQDRNTCVLFGDGAGAAIVSGQGSSQARIVDSLLRADGSLGDLLPVGIEGNSARPYTLGQQVGEEYFIQMKGRELFRHAVRGMAELTLDILGKNGLSIADIDLFIPHQANMRIIEALAKKLACPLEKVYINVDRYGNTSAASVGIALGEAVELGQVKTGAKVLLVSFGAGLTWGATLLQF